MVPFGSTRECLLVREEGLNKFGKKWTFQSEFCGLEEKREQTGTAIVGPISKVQKAQFLKYAYDVFMKPPVFEPPPPP